MKAGPKERLRLRIQEWAGRLKVKPQVIRIQAMTQKWGSCSSAGRVSFSLDLTRRPVAFQDFVIVHELLHLRIRNHGALFHATLRAHLRGNPWAKGTPLQRKPRKTIAAGIRALRGDVKWDGDLELMRQDRIQERVGT